MLSVESESVRCEECVLCEFIRSWILNDRVQVQKRKKKIVANVFTSSIIKVACPLRFLSIRSLDDLERVCEHAGYYKTWNCRSFAVMIKKCIKQCASRAGLLFCWLNQLFFVCLLVCFLTLSLPSPSGLPELPTRSKNHCRIFRKSSYAWRSNTSFPGSVSYPLSLSLSLSFSPPFSVVRSS